MKSVRSVVSALLLACSGAAATVPTGRIEGRITIVDNGKAREDAGNVAVWIEGTRVEDPAQPRAEVTAPKMVSQRKTFIPRVVAVSIGRPVSFPNEDPIFHNVFSVSGVNHFDLGLYRSGRSKDRAFSAPGLVRVYCNIHPQMVGYVRVVDSSFATVTGPGGTFSFDGVPAGERVVRAWCEAGGETSTTVQLRPRQASTVALTFDVSAFKPQPHKNKYGQDYPPPPPDEDRY
jgi:plastocyanin